MILQVTLTASPAGGMFSGDGITDAVANGTFDPAVAGVGTHTITYDLYRWQWLHVIVQHADVVVYALPVVSVSGGPFCVDDAATNLTGKSSRRYVIVEQE